MTARYYVSEDYELDNVCGKRKGSVVGADANIITIKPIGHPIEKFWPSARAFTHERELFLSPLSSNDITRLCSPGSRRIFFLSRVYIPNMGAESDYYSVLFAYQTLSDNQVHWTLRTTTDAQRAVKAACFRFNAKAGLGFAAATALTFPMSLFFAKRLSKQSFVEAEALPSMGLLQRFVQRNCKR